MPPPRTDEVIFCNDVAHLFHSLKLTHTHTHKQTSPGIQQKTEQVDGATTEEYDGARFNRGPLRLSFRTRRRQVIATPTSICEPNQNLIRCVKHQHCSFLLHTDS